MSRRILLWASARFGPSGRANFTRCFRLLGIPHFSECLLRPVLGLAIACLLIVGHAYAEAPAVSDAQKEWDTSSLGVNKDWSEPGTNPNNKNAPTRRLKKLTSCVECQPLVDELQGLLDEPGRQPGARKEFVHSAGW
jgi:hypothetical protein